MKWDATQVALIREAAIASHSLSSGLGAMSKANYAKVGLYGEAFFGIAIGFERLLKIVCLLDFLATSNAFPTDQELRSFGRDIEDLFARADEIRLKYKVKNEALVPPGSIEFDLFRFISRFSASTMYHNLEFYTGKARGNRGRDPVSDWFDEVARHLFDAHLSTKRKAAFPYPADLIDRLTATFSSADHDFGDGTAAPGDFQAAQRDLNKVLQKYVPFHCARICRYLYEILLKLTREAQAAVSCVEVPNLDGLFFPFVTTDAQLVGRKTFPAKA